MNGDPTVKSSTAVTALVAFRSFTWSSSGHEHDFSSGPRITRFL